MKQTETLFEIKMFCYQSATSEQQCGEKYITKLRKSLLDDKAEFCLDTKNATNKTQIKNAPK